MKYLLTSRLAWSLAALLALFAAGPAEGQRPILKGDKSVMAAFLPVVARASLSTVTVLCGNAEVALGTVVDADGWIITKYSELTGPVRVRLRDGKTYDAKVEGVESKYDLAMLKIAATKLTPVEWAHSKTAEQGDWLAATANGEGPLAIGVVSVAAREPKAIEMPFSPPPKDSGFLGVLLSRESGAAKIESVVAKEAAAKAGLKAGDVVLKLQDEPVSDSADLITRLQGFKVGDVIKLRVRRDGEERDFQVTLGTRPPNQTDRGDQQNAMGSTLSAKRGGFPFILQTDLIIPHTQCGGPAVTLDGKVVGVFIARAGRTESYVIPSERVEGLLGDLKSGKLRPRSTAAVNLKDLQKAVVEAKAAYDAKRKALRRAEEADDRDEAKVEALKAELNALRQRHEQANRTFREANGDATKEEKPKAEDPKKKDPPKGDPQAEPERKKE